MIALQLAFLPLAAWAAEASSSHYRLEESDFTVGGETASSTNYRTYDALGGSGDASSSSANYRGFPGLVLPMFPGVPGQPSLANTGGQMYNTLDFAVNPDANSSDVNYAIAITPDSWAATYYVQADDTLGSAPVWQTYADWGGAAGERLVNLSYNTTYIIKVKARYGPDSETDYSLPASAATVNPTLSLEIIGKNAGVGIGGATTTVATTANGVTFGNIQSGSINIAAQEVRVSTNATGGYTVSVKQDGDLRKGNGVAIPPVTATNPAPAPWPTGFIDGRFGYHTTDASLCTGNASRFAPADTYARLEIQDYEVACSTGPAASETTGMVYKVEIGPTQPPGHYQNQIIYIATAQY